MEFIVSGEEIFRLDRRNSSYQPVARITPPPPSNSGNSSNSSGSWNNSGSISGIEKKWIRSTPEGKILFYGAGYGVALLLALEIVPNTPPK